MFTTNTQAYQRSPISTMQDDRRKAPRVRANIDVKWQGVFGVKKGSISDISVIGCFVLCSGEVVDGEIVKITVTLPRNRQIILFGEVVYHTHELGFAVRFVRLGEEEEVFLKKLVDRLFQRAARSEGSY